MKVWVVTGPIGAGKSAVSTLLSQRGAIVVNADHLGHEVLKMPSVMNELAGEFGAEIIADGDVDRRQLGALVFGNQGAMDKLNAICHPPLLDLVAFRLEKLAKEGNHELAVLEAAVYFLWPPMKMVDMIISVVADEDVRLHRLMQGRGLSSEQIRDRMKAQENLDRFWKTADFIIDNNSHPEALEAVVDELLRINNL